MFPTLSFALALVQLAKTNPVLSRVYTAGEHLVYQMTGLNEDRVRTIRYSAQAAGEVKKDADGHYFEEFSWSGLEVNKRSQDLTPASESFRQVLSLSADFNPPMPSLSEVQPMLIGPITDLLTFYVDLKLAMGLPGLAKPGDKVKVPYGKPASWADGKYVLLGSDAIDFELTLKSVDRKHDTATVEVRHVPPVLESIKFPVPWMSKPVVGKHPNNWVEVVQNRSGHFTAAVGEETFVVEIQIRLSDGAIVKADQENTVEVLERECSDSSLQEEGKSVRYRIHRRIELRS